MDGYLRERLGPRPAPARVRHAQTRGRGLPRPLQGPVPGPHRVRPARVPDLVQQPQLGPTDRATTPPRALHPLDAGDRRYKSSAVSRRVAVVAGFYQTCVIDAVLTHSPAEHVRRPNVPV